MGEIIVIDTSKFINKGGWKVDTQFVVNMGTPYLLAHGLGAPVENAVARFSSKNPGRYHLFVYTYNWVTPWNDKIAPGRFNVVINNKKVLKEFGKDSKKWSWEYGGEVDILAGNNELCLVDLTGFEGRVGLICLTNDSDISLPIETNEFLPFIIKYAGNTVIEEEKYEMIICGAGIAGICTALSSSRNNVKTLLIQDRPVVGGNNSSEVRVWLGGETNFEPFSGIGNIVNELEQKKVGHYGAENIGENYEDDKKIKLLQKEKNLTVLLNHILVDVEMIENRIKKIYVWDINTCTLKIISAELFCDTTGDSTLADLAGADYEVTTNGHMGMTNPWYVEKNGSNITFPRCEWAINLYNVDFPGRKQTKDIYGNTRERSLGCWFWESGCELDPIREAEYTRDLNFRAMYGAWDAIKNKDHDYEGYQLKYASYISGKRESRRVFGDVILTKNDVVKGNKYPDGVVPSTWNFDVHYPDRKFYGAFYQGDSFITKDYHESFKKPFFIPYRCLYSRNIVNLFMAGRNVSVSHDALGTVRVMRTGGMMGEVIGYAAKMCIKNKILPREIYTYHLEEFLQELKSIPKGNLTPLVANVNAEGQEL